MPRQTTEQQQIEARISKVASTVPELSFGYIGNDERWGDDRLLHIWVRNLRQENGNRVSLWSCRAIDLDQVENRTACHAVHGFRTAIRLIQAPARR